MLAGRFAGLARFGTYGTRGVSRISAETDVKQREVGSNTRASVPSPDERCLPTHRNTGRFVLIFRIYLPKPIFELPNLQKLPDYQLIQRINHLPPVQKCLRPVAIIPPFSPGEAIQNLGRVAKRAKRDTYAVMKLPRSVEIARSTT